MFSIVTALVSPQAVEALRGKRDTLVSTLTENANVLCFQPNDSICLLQGEWDSIKKAYAILEEFYFRAQAEVMVREMLKGNVAEVASDLHHNEKNDPGLGITNWSSSLLSTLFPFVDHQLPMEASLNTQEGEEDGRTHLFRRVAMTRNQKSKNRSRATEDGHSKNTDAELVDTTTKIGKHQVSDQNECEDNEDLDEEENDEPPVLMKEGPFNADIVSLVSEMSNPKEMDFYDSSSSGTMIANCHGTAGSRCNQAIAESADSSKVSERKAKAKEQSQDGGEDLNNEPSQLINNHLCGTGKSALDAKKKDLVSPSPTNLNSAHDNSSSSPTLLVDNQKEAINSTAAAFRTRPFLSEKMSSPGCTLPQLSSLLLGGTTLPQGIPAWQYADLYSMHLSALQSTIRIKQEPSSFINTSDLALLPPDRCDDSFKTDVGYKFDDETPLQEMRCTQCNKAYRSEARMKEHIRTHDKNYVPVLHSCPKCNKSFTYRHNMVVHLRRFHYGWQPAKRHACRVCGIRFQKPYLLRLHEHKAHILQA